MLQRMRSNGKKSHLYQGYKKIFLPLYVSAALSVAGDEKANLLTPSQLKLQELLEKDTIVEELTLPELAKPLEEWALLQDKATDPESKAQLDLLQEKWG